MIDFKRMDEKDFVFLNEPLSDKDEQAFSDFLKSRKKKSRAKRIENRKGKIQKRAIVKK